GLGGFGGRALRGVGCGGGFGIREPVVQAVTTNVPGPRFPLYLLGRQMVSVHPYVPIGNNLRIGVAIFSYLDSFSFGITADYGSVPEADLDILTPGIGRGLAELRRASH